MYEHPEITHSGIFTCAACQTANDQRGYEWPPKIFVCARCGRVYEFMEENDDGTTRMKFVYQVKI